MRRKGATGAMASFKYMARLKRDIQDLISHDFSCSSSSLTVTQQEGEGFVLNVCTPIKVLFCTKRPGRSEEGPCSLRLDDDASAATALGALEDGRAVGTLVGFVALGVALGVGSNVGSKVGSKVASASRTIV